MKTHFTAKLMGMLLVVALLATALPAMAQGGEWPRTVLDGTGTEVTLDAAPTRIASVTLASDEILLSMIDSARLIGVTNLAADPGISNVAALASAVPNVVTADPELLISLDPDLVIVATWTDPAVVDQLREAGLTVFMMPLPVGVDAIQEAIALMGELVGAEAEAAAIVASMEAQLSNAAEAVATGEPQRVLYLTPGNYTSGTPSTISEIIAAAGGIDVAAEAGVSQYEPLSDEFIIEQDPDVILLSGWTPWDPNFSTMFAENSLFSGLSAVQNGRVYLANDGHMTTTSQFIADGVADIASMLHPDLFPPYPLTFSDALGTEITLDSRPETVVSLTLGTDEILTQLLAEQPDNIAGLTYLVDDPSISNVAGTDLLGAVTSTRVEADPEQLIALNPDVVFAATFTDQAVMDQLRDAGIPVVANGYFNSVAAMLDNITFVGDVIGERAAAQLLIGTLTDRLEAVAATTAMVEAPKSVIYLATDNWIAGCATTLDDMIQRAGGANAACEAGLFDWNQVDAETLLSIDPDVVVLSSWVDLDSWLADSAYQGLAAVQSGTVISGNDAHLSAVSQYIVDGVEDLAQILYPDLF